MKEQYIRQVEKELKAPRKIKGEVLRDLQEAFASALEHGETEAQVIQRLGTPKEFANSAAEQLGLDPARGKRRKQLLACLLRPLRLPAMPPGSFPKRRRMPSARRTP